MPEQSKIPVIEVRYLEIGYGSFILVRDVSFTVKTGEVMAIMGQSGCGKSSLLKYLIGLKEVEKGEILYDGKCFSRASPEEKARIQQSFGVLFQSGALWSDRTLAENVALPLEQYTALTPNEIYEVCHHAVKESRLERQGGRRELYGWFTFATNFFLFAGGSRAELTV